MRAWNPENLVWEKCSIIFMGFWSCVLFHLLIWWFHSWHCSELVSHVMVYNSKLPTYLSKRIQLCMVRHINTKKNDQASAKLDLTFNNIDLTKLMSGVRLIMYVRIYVHTYVHTYIHTYVCSWPPKHDGYENALGNIGQACFDLGTDLWHMTQRWHSKGDNCLLIREE